MKILCFILFLAIGQTLSAQSKSYTIVFLNNKPEAEKIDKATQEKLMEGHMANINRLAKEGKLLAAGPFDGGGGLFVFNTTSETEAKNWVSSDPGVQANRWNIELLPYTPRRGSICRASEPLQMVSYTFFRFDAIVDKFTASTYPELIMKHDAYIKEATENLTIVTEAIFGDNQGGILILKEDLPASVFERDPGVQQGLLNVQAKKLYIPKGNFCEQ